MRKSSKILALVLTLVMLLGVIAVYAFADETPAAQQPNIVLSGLTGVRHWGKANWNIEGDPFKSHYSATTGTVPGERGTKNYTYWESKYAYADDGVTRLNGYSAFYHDAGAPGHEIGGSGSGPYFDFSYTVNAQNALAAQKYIVMDWDISSDKYIDANGSLTDAATDAEGNPHKLAYGGSFSFATRAPSGTYDTAVYPNNYNTGLTFLQGSFGEDEKGPFIKLSNAAGVSGNIYLKDEAGVWNHMTLVVAIDNRVDYTVAGDPTVKTAPLSVCNAENGTIVKTYYATSTMYVYLDGELVISGAVGTAAEDSNVNQLHRGLYNARWSAPSATTSFSVCVDNVTTHYYAADYTGPMTADFSPTSAPEVLGAYSDMVFNNTYVYPAPNTPVATITTLAGVTTDYYMLSAAVASLEKNCTLTLHPGATLMDYEAYFPFRVNCAEGAFSVLSTTYTHGDYIPASGSIPGGYEVGEAKDTLPIFYYVDEQSAINDLEDEGIFDFLGKENYAAIPFGQKMLVPQTSVTGIKDFVLDENNNYTLFTGWKALLYDSTEGKLVPFDLETVITGEEDFIDEGYINVYPTYETGKLLYAIYNSNNEIMKDTTGSYAQYTKADTFVTEINAALGTGVAYVRLLDDVIINNYSKYISVGSGNPNIYIDLNGHDLVMATHGGAVSGFNFSYSGDAYIYSSQPGGRIFHMDSAADKGEALFSITGGNSLNLGKVIDPVTGVTADGDNLSIYATTLVSMHNRTFSCDVNIDGGQYYCTKDVGAGFFYFGQYNLLKIKNATIFTAAKEIFTTDKGFTRPVGSDTPLASNPMKTEITVSNSDIIAAPGASIFGELYLGVKATFTNSNLYGSLALSLLPSSPYEDINLTNALLGKVHLGEGVKINDAASYEHIVYADGLAPLPYTDPTAPLTVTYYIPEFDDDKITLPESLETPITVNIDALTRAMGSSAGLDTVTVTFQDHDGTFIETVTEIQGMDIAGPVSKVTEIDLDNAWFNLGFSYWADATTGEKVDFTKLAAGAEITVKAVCETPSGDVLGYANMSLMTKFTIHTYMPAVGADGTLTVSANGKDYIISAVSYISNADKAVTGSVVEIGGMPYAKFNLGYPDAVTYTNKTTITYYVSFTVTAADDATNTVSVTKAPVTNNYAEVSAYLIKALESSTNEADKQLVANVIQYCNALYDYRYTLSGTADNSSTNVANHQKLVDIIAKDEYKGYVTDIASAEFNSALADAKVDATIPAGLAEHVEGVTFYYFGSMPTLAVVPAEIDYKKTQINSVVVNVGKFANTNATTLSLAPDHPDAPGSFGGTNPNKNYTTAADSVGVWMNVQTHLPAYYGTNDFTFSIGIKNGEEDPTVYTVQYNLATYILSVEANGEASALELQGAKVARAFLAYAECALEFVTTPEQ